MKHSSGVPLSLGLCVGDSSEALFGCLCVRDSSEALFGCLCVRDSSEALFGCSSIFRFVCKGL